MQEALLSSRTARADSRSLAPPQYIWTKHTSKEELDSDDLSSNSTIQQPRLDFVKSSSSSRSISKQKTSPEESDLAEKKLALRIRRAFRNYQSNTQTNKINDEYCSGTIFQPSGQLHIEDRILTRRPAKPIFKTCMKQGSLLLPHYESVLVLGGVDPDKSYGVDHNTGRNIFRYDLEANHWELVGELPKARHHHACAYYNSRVFVVGGADPLDEDVQGHSVVVGTVWSLDPVSSLWCEECPLMTPRKNCGLAVLDGKLWAIGGQDKHGNVLTSVEIFDEVTRMWLSGAPINAGRAGLSVVKYQGSLWVVGGMVNAKKGLVTSSVEYYECRTRKWMFKSSLRFARCYSCLINVNETMYLIGGAGKLPNSEQISSCNAIDVWNSRDDQWKLHYAMTLPRHGHAVAYLGTQIFIIGGVTTAYFKALGDIECFCCEEKTWVKGITSLPIALSGLGAVTLPAANM